MSILDANGAMACAECGKQALTVRDRLKAENDRLRKQGERLFDKVMELGTENAKLRELLTDLAVCACGKYCYGCPHQYDGCDRDERLRELGMEVEE